MSSHQSTKDECDKIFKAYKEKCKKKKTYHYEDYSEIERLEKDFFHKKEDVRKKQEEQKKLNLKNLYEEKSIINIYGLSCRGHFETLSKLLKDNEKIKKLRTMNNDKCCEIDYSNGYSVEVINKDGVLHIRAANNINVFNVIYRIVDISIHGQLYIIGNFFGDNDAISKVDELLTIPIDRCMVYSNHFVPKDVYTRTIDNEIIFSGISF